MEHSWTYGLSTAPCVSSVMHCFWLFGPGLEAGIRGWGKPMGNSQYVHQPCHDCFGSPHLGLHVHGKAWRVCCYVATAAGMQDSSKLCRRLPFLPLRGSEIGRCSLIAKKCPRSGARQPSRCEISTTQPSSDNELPFPRQVSSELPLTNNLVKKCHMINFGRTHGKRTIPKAFLKSRNL